MTPDPTALLLATALSWTTPAAAQVVNNWNLITVTCAGANHELDFTLPGPTAAISPRSYQRFSDAQAQVIVARIYQGIHFRYADEEGRRQGARGGHWIFQKFLKPAK